MKTVKKAVKKTVKRTSVKAKTKAKISRPLGKKSGVGKKIAVPGRSSIDVIEMSENSFIIAINGARNFFERDEMKAIVRICQLASSESDAAMRLYAWFSNKRKDVLIDTKIFDPHDTALKTMYNYLVNTYSVSK
jgi:predicted ribosome-associated RNA-binding protein Tma20